LPAGVVNEITHVPGGRASAVRSKANMSALSGLLTAAGGRGALFVDPEPTWTTMSASGRGVNARPTAITVVPALIVVVLPATVSATGS